MFTKVLKAAAIAATLAIGTVAGTGAASAHDRGITFGNSDFSITFGSGQRHRHFHDDRGFRRNACRPRRALRKAKRRGLRRAYIHRVGQRGVIVKGRHRGERVTVGIANRRGCPVRFVRAR